MTHHTITENNPAMQELQKLCEEWSLDVEDCIQDVQELVECDIHHDWFYGDVLAAL